MKFLANVGGVIAGLALIVAANATAHADIDKSAVEAGRAIFNGKIDASHDLVVRIDRGDEPLEWRSSRTGGGEFEVVVEASDKIRLEGGKTGHGFVVASKILTSSDIKYVHCAGDLAGTFAIRREADFVTEDGVLTFADITLKEGKKLPVSLRLAVSLTVAPARADDADDKVPPAVGDANAGRDVFRFETFGNEGFWTDAMRLPQGMKKEKVTPLQLLETGFHIDADALDAELRKTLTDEFKTDRSAAQAPSLNDPAMTMKIVEANALIGVVPKEGKVGIACAICHTITDASVAELPGKGSIGKRLDGRATHSLDMGKALAIAENSRAAYPNLQLELGGNTIGRAPKGLRKDSTEEEVDAFLKNPEFYPRGTFDETQDGIGNPVQNTPLFRQDLAGPYGSAGEFAVLDHIGNASFTTNLDPTTLVTPEGREFLNAKAGKLGEELADNYAFILKETGVTDYPFVTASTGHKVGDLASPVGRKVDMKKVRDMSAYIKALPAPPGLKGDAETIARGKNLFRANCTKCHNEDQSKPVSTNLVELKDLWPAYQPETLAQRKPPLSPIVNSPGGFDDKMVVIDASDRMEKRGNALPLLLDLARKPMFLHDASVNGLDALLDPKRGADVPHPFYVEDIDQRADMVVFLKSLDAREPGGDSKKEPTDKDLPTIKKPAPSPRSAPVIPRPDAAAAEVPAGYRVEVVVAGLQCPSSIEFDSDNFMGPVVRESWKVIWTDRSLGGRFD